jgi:hypothetical protein
MTGLMQKDIFGNWVIVSEEGTPVQEKPPEKEVEPPELQLATQESPAEEPLPPEPPPEDQDALEEQGQGTLFDILPKWKDTWKGMPEYEHRDLTPTETVYVHFRNLKDRHDFEKLVGQRIIKYAGGPGTIWYPKIEIGRFADKRYESAEPVNPKYPVYIISKGRWESRLTSKSLEKMGVPYHIVVEPQEYEQYAAVINPEKILVTPFSNLGQGSIPVRNWVWSHSMSIGVERHWILDDNINGFFRYNENLKTPVGDGTIFRAAENFVDRYENVAISGFQYFMFVSRKSGDIPPFTMNTRIYSCILIQNDIPYEWRGRYNEDTDLSIRALKDGWCTVLFNAFLAFKETTMKMKGGNTDELYKGNGRLLMAQSLVDQHPDVVKVSWKWGRHQHHVNYKPFAKNKLKPKPGISVEEGINNFDMELKKLGEN